jgi:mono/diheme cytochrome c family protein
MKRRTKKSLLRSLLAIPVLVIGAFLYLLFRGPSADPPSRVQVSMAPDRIERGKYVFTVLASCDECHSQHDFSLLGGPVTPGGRGKGMVMPLAGLPGTIVASNITPDRATGIGTWSDGEKIRAIREGVGKDGRALYPLMPYQGYSVMSDEDVEAVVAYMNSLPAVSNPLPKTSVSFPASMFIKGVPQPIGHSIPRVDPDGGEIYGEYLTTVAACEGCHTQLNFMGNPIAALRFAGGRLFETPFGKVVSANITQDKETGIGKWNFQEFKEKMHSYAHYEQDEFPKVGPDRFTLMPWVSYAHMDDHDLESIFIYLKAVKPVSNRVESHPR